MQTAIPQYFPPENGLYEVAPGLKPFGSDLGQGEADQKVFQIDGDFSIYRQNKTACRGEAIEKYYQQSDFDGEIEASWTRFISQKLTAEYPDLFKWQQDENGSLQCSLTGETLVFNPDYQLIKTVADTDPKRSYRGGLDALAMQVPEDLAIWRLQDERNWLAALHLCAPNYWSPADKIGDDFIAVHRPVAENSRIIKPAASLVEAMIVKGPWVRFAWGVTTDKHLNHHPDPPAGQDPGAWRGRAFDSKKPQAYLRVERQVVWGMAENQSCLFTIRTYFYDLHDLKKDVQKRSKLVSALKSMTPASRRYKGLENHMAGLLNWLED